MTAAKICGLTRPEDVAAACELGASILGFNFVAASPRRVTAERAREISAAVAAGVLKAGVFAAGSRAGVARAVQEAALQIVQLHRPVESADLETLRADVVAKLEFLGVAVDPVANARADPGRDGDADISTSGARVRTCVVRSREDVEIARLVGQALRDQ